jgi:hypothetical protein
VRDRGERHVPDALKVTDDVLRGQAPLGGDDGGHVRVGTGQVRVEHALELGCGRLIDGRGLD